MTFILKIEGPSNERDWPLEVGGEPVTIGRDPSATIHLSDPERMLSRRHVSLMSSGSAVQVTVVSSVNGVITSQGELAPGETGQFGLGDTLTLGAYTIRIESAAPATEALSVPSRRDTDFDPFAALETTPASEPDRPGLNGGLHAFGQNLAAWPSAAAHVVGGLDTRLNQPPLDADRQLDGPDRSSGRHLLGEPGAVATSAAALDINAWLSHGDPVGAPSRSDRGLIVDDHVHDFNLPLSLPDVRTAGADRESVPVGWAARGPDSSDPWASLQAGWVHGLSDADAVPKQLHRPVSMGPVGRQDGAASQDSRSNSTTAAAAFARGLGLLDMPEQSAADWERMGTVVRHVVGTLVELLKARRDLKRELRVSDRTMLAPRDNNPLKTGIDLPSVLRYLLITQGSEHGFKLAEAALDESLEDLRIHDLATTAACRATVEAALREFDPRVLREELAAGKSRLPQFLDNARLWEAYVEHHDQKLNQLADWMEKLFSSHFVPAYSQFVDRSKPTSQGSPSSSSTSG
jgi:predicted component of type VI protein secretion system